MKIPLRFFQLIVKRDFNPIQGQKNSSLHFFQCRLPIWGSWVILFILCLTGIVCLGVHGGIKNHLTILENNPFVSAIRIEGSFSRAKITKLKSLLFLNTQNQTFETTKQPQPYHKKVIQAVYPFNLVSLRFLDRTGTTLLTDAYDVLSVKVQQPANQNKNQTDDDIKKWMTRHMKAETFFEPYAEASLNYGLVLSESLYNQMGFEKPFDSEMDEIRISFLSTDGKYNLLEDRAREGKELWAPLDSAEKMKYVVTAPLVNVSSHLPGGDALISEGCYDVLTKGKYFSPCKRIEHFYIHFQQPYQELDRKITIQWANAVFGKHVFRKPYFAPNGKTIKFQFQDLSFNPEYYNITTLCHVKSQFLHLKSMIDIPLRIDFKDDPPTYSEKTSTYYYAYLYINKDQEILDNINLLTKFIKNKFESYIEDHQVMTLKKYRSDMSRINWIVFWVFLSIATLMLVYISVTFGLFLQTKMHNIGMMMSFGAPASLIKKIYLFESLKLAIFPLIISIVLALIIWAITSFMTHVMFALSICSVIFYILVVISVALSGAWFAVQHIISQSPYQLISYKT
ncbi:membrane protein [Candidatus Magnetomorum sp. HK-1]|nr:membrane protein [Candidatus Magnetomorum sp. HK-1]